MTTRCFSNLLILNFLLLRKSKPWGPTYISKHFSSTNTCFLTVSIKAFGKGNTVNITVFLKRRKRGRLLSNPRLLLWWCPVYMVTVLPPSQPQGSIQRMLVVKCTVLLLLFLLNIFLFHLCFHLSRPNCVGCGILVPQLGTEPVLPAVEATES